MGIEHGSESKKIVVNKITDISKLPKNPSSWIGDRPYFFEKDGQKYMFWKNGRGGTFNKKTGKYEMQDTHVLLSKINSLSNQKTPKTAEIKVVKENTEQNLKTLKNSIIQDPGNREIFDPQRQMFNDLRKLVKQKNHKAIAKHLAANTTQYEEFMKSEYFLDLLKEAKKNPTGNALVLQLYGKYYLKDDSISVDGIYGNQTKGIRERYVEPTIKPTDIEQLGNKGEKRREEIHERIREKYLSSPKEQQLSMSISAQFNKAIPDEKRSEYLKDLSLDDGLIDNLLTKEEKSRQKPEIDRIRNLKKIQLYNRTMRSAQTACVNYLQAIFNTTINVKNTEPITLSVSDNLDPNRDTKIHDGESIDFNIISNGVPLKVCYNLKEGTIAYDASFSMSSGGLNKGHEIKILSGIPSLPSLIQKGKEAIVSASLSGENGREKLKTEIESLSTPEVEYQNRQIIEKMVAREDCMKSIKKLTAYDLPHDLPKEIYQNTQIYTLYDILDHTFKADTTTAQDMYNFKYNIIEKLNDIVAYYTNPQKPKFIKNLRTKYFTQEKLQKDQKDIIAPKINEPVDKSLSFYLFFSQFLKNAGAEENTRDYRVLDFLKMETAINEYYKNGYLPDTTIVASIEKEEKNSIESLLSNIE